MSHSFNTADEKPRREKPRGSANPATGSALAVCSGAFLLACSTATTHVESETAPVGLVGAAITFDRSDTGRNAFHAPLVRGSIGGRETLFVLDTGAELHVVDAALADAAGIETMQVGGRIEVGNGDAVRARGTVDPRMVIDGWGGVPAHATLVLPLPDDMRAAGIGGIVGVALLATLERPVLLDLEQGRLTSGDHAALVRSIRTRPLLLADAQNARVCRHGTAPAEAVSLVVSGTVAGVPALLSLDTGSLHANVLANVIASAGLNATDTTRTYDVAGERETRTLREVSIAIGELEARSDIWITDGAPDPHCAFVGQIGIDILRRCALLLGTSDLTVRCARQ